MPWWGWVAVGVPLYLGGWIIFAALNERDCKRSKHDDCEHTFDAFFWPIVGVFIAVFGPLYLLSQGVKHSGHWLATLPERKAARVAEELAEHERLTARVAELEAELGIEWPAPPRSPDQPV